MWGPCAYTGLIVLTRGRRVCVYVDGNRVIVLNKTFTDTGWENNNGQ